MLEASRAQEVEDNRLAICVKYVSYSVIASNPQMDQVGKVERMKQCILEGMHPNFARPLVPQMVPPHYQHGAPPPPPEFFYNYHPAGAPLPPMPQYPRGRGMMGESTSQRSVRIEVV